MKHDEAPTAVAATGVPPRTNGSVNPDPFASRISRRERRMPGDVSGLRNFGVNLTGFASGGEPALVHAHSSGTSWPIRSDRDLVNLEFGGRPEGDEGACPQDDIKAVMGANVTWCYTGKDGTGGDGFAVHWKQFGTHDVLPHAGRMPTVPTADHRVDPSSGCRNLTGGGERDRVCLNRGDA